MLIQFSSSHSNSTFTLTNIYGPCDGPECQNFVDSLRALDISPTNLWLFVGDFNFICSAKNRNKPGGNVDGMMLFNEIISEQSLIEIPIKGHQFTWSNMQGHPLLEQLNWVFTSVEWTSAFPNTFARAQAKPISDHIPYVVCIETPIPPYNLFRFESYWLLHPVFMDVVQCCWNLPSRATNSATSLSAKFKNLCRGLKQWSKSISKLHLLLENCNAVLSQLDGLEDCRPLSVSERNFRVIL